MPRGKKTVKKPVKSVKKEIVMPKKKEEPVESTDMDFTPSVEEIITTDDKVVIRKNKIEEV